MSRSIEGVSLLFVFVAVAACSPVVASPTGEPAVPEPAAVSDRLAHYLALPAPDPAEARNALESLEWAMESWHDGRHLEGALQADLAMARLPTLADWRPLVFAELLVPTGDTAGVRAAIEEIDPATELFSLWGWRILADAYEEGEDPAAAGAAARAQAQVEADPGREAEQWSRAGRMALALGDSTLARNDLWTALEKGDRYAGAREAARTLDRLPGDLGPAEELMVGRALLAAGAWERAHQRLAPHLGSSLLDPEEADQLRVGLGRALFELRRYPDAETMLAPLTGRDVPSEAVLSALFWSGRSALQRGSVASAEGHFRRLARLDPRSRLAEEGLLLLLTRELATGFGPRARGFLDELLEVDLRSPAAELTVVQLGTSLYLNGDPSTAALTFDRYLERSRNTTGRQQAAYWSANLHERNGRTELSRLRLLEVHREDPFSYYGILAGERVGAPVLPADLPGGPRPGTGLEREHRNALIRLRAHQLVPTPGSFAYELDRIKAHAALQESAYDLAESLIEGGFPLQGIVLGRDIHREEREWNLRLLRIVHPFPHAEIVIREARARGLDPFFVAGLIRQESMFHAEIRSVAGAIGLMQLMPATAREVAGTLGIRYAPEALTDPETNVRLGVTYLANMLSRFDGRAEDALSAYNAGPTRIRQWQQLPEYRDREVFVEHIPFQETRHYVKVVQQYARVYTALYGCGEFEPCLGLSYPEAVARSPFGGGVPNTVLAR